MNLREIRNAIIEKTRENQSYNRACFDLIFRLFPSKELSIIKENIEINSALTFGQIISLSEISKELKLQIYSLNVNLSSDFFSEESKDTYHRYIQLINPSLR